MGLLGEIHGNSKPFQLRNGRKGWLINCSQANPSHQSKPLKTWMAMSMVEFGKFWKPLKMSRIATQKTDLMQSGAPESCTSDEPLPIHLQLGQVAKWQRRCPDDGPGWRPHVPCRNSREVVWIKHNEAKRSDCVKRLKRELKGETSNIHKTSIKTSWAFDGLNKYDTLCVSQVQHRDHLALLFVHWPKVPSSGCAAPWGIHSPCKLCWGNLPVGRMWSIVSRCIKGYGKRSKPFKT